MKSFTGFLAFAAVHAFGPNPTTTTTTTTVAPTKVPPVTTPVVVPTTTKGTPATGTYTVKEPVQTAQGTINFNGGNVMANGVNVYGIFYGSHSSKTQSLIQNFVNGLSTSDWWTVVTSYTGDNGAINSQVKWAGSYQDNYSLGKNLQSGDLDTIIDNAVTNAGWPKDDNGIYAVFVYNDVAEQSSNGGFCTQYCGYHGVTQSGLKSNMIGDATRCPGTLPPPGGSTGTAGCMPRYYRNQTDPTYSINGDQHADSMIDVLAHEIAETASDYDNAWRDGQGYENGDKCAPYFIKVQGIGATSPYNGAYNVDFGSNGKFLIQSMWSADKQGCLLKESDTPAIKHSMPLTNIAPVTGGEPAPQRIFRMN
ncbi:hypothetical protein HDV06_001834 [Boothiomyces sp. JEL0866]|nr:hypothetical protein HDV06_001834 [Boothiomyces sp. JEL0866]